MSSRASGSAERLKGDQHLFVEAFPHLTRVGMGLSFIDGALTALDAILPESYRQEDVERVVTRQECEGED